MVVSRRDGERLLFEAYPKLAQEPKYVYTYITRAVFWNSNCFEPKFYIEIIPKTLPSPLESSTKFS
jgi:hypothetical protein